ncbi:MAG: tetratricopeptide repeat protein, partial [Ignavibacteria bacterium]
QVYFERGKTYHVLKEYLDAIRDFSYCIKLNPKDSKAYVQRGLSKISFGKVKEGCNDLTTAGELGNFDAYSLINKYCK